MKLVLRHSIPINSFAAKPKLYEVIPIAIYILSALFTKTLLFPGKSTYIIIHNNLEAENQRRVHSSLAMGRQ